jgi:hypothetical protein
MPTEAETFRSRWLAMSTEERLAHEAELIKFLRNWRTVPTMLAADHIELLRSELDAQPS